MTWQEFADNFKPLKRTMSNGDEVYPYETYGEELDFVRSQPAENIWTEIDGEGGCFIISGYRLVNRIQYYVCEVPVSTEAYAEVVVSLERDCDCAVEGEGKPDCDECEGSGYKTIWIDTREELIEIYGEDYANEQL